MHDIEKTSYWRLYDATSHRRHFDVMCLLGSTKTGVLKVVWPWKWNLPCSERYIANKIWTHIISFFICSAWLYVKELEKIIARTHCFMHQSFFRPNYFFNKASQAIQSPRTVPFFLLFSLLDGYSFANVLVKDIVAFKHKKTATLTSITDL